MLLLYSLFVGGAGSALPGGITTTSDDNETRLSWDELMTWSEANVVTTTEGLLTTRLTTEKPKPEGVTTSTTEAEARADLITEKKGGGGQEEEARGSEGPPDKSCAFWHRKVCYLNLSFVKCKVTTDICISGIWTVGCSWCWGAPQQCNQHW